jgi:hypothetical protein
MPIGIIIKITRISVITAPESKTESFNSASDERAFLCEHAQDEFSGVVKFVVRFVGGGRGTLELASDPRNYGEVLCSLQPLRSERVRPIARAD